MKIVGGIQSNKHLKLVICVCIGLITWRITTIIPHPISIDGVDIGDVGVPIYGFQRWMAGENPYGLYHGDHELIFQYPFTGMLALAPFLIFPLKFILPIMMTLSAMLLAWGCLKENRIWRLLIFLSFPYISAIHSGQLSLFVAAAITLPILFPISVVKPQSSIFILPNVRWPLYSVMISLVIIIASFILYPEWIIDWLRNGSIALYDGWIPLLTLPGVLLAVLIPLVRIPRARLLLSLSVMPQRLFYDQVAIFLLPSSFVQMLTMVILSWIIAFISRQLGWIAYFGQQDHRAQLLTVVGLYLPMLISILRQSWRDERNLLNNIIPTRNVHQ